MNSMQQNDDGSWSPAEPLPFLGWKAKLEQMFWRVGMKRSAIFMAKWDEKDLGK